MIPVLPAMRHITVIQVSTVHRGLCSDPQAALDDLFQRMVRTGTATTV